VILAQYHIDFIWYRAKIMKVLDESVDRPTAEHQFEVLFIDYGNSSPVTVEK